MKRQNYSEKAETNQVLRLAKKVFGLKLDKIVKSGSKANIIGLKSEHILFSQRIDSRTYFVQDQRYGKSKDFEHFQGSDEEHFKFCYNILEHLDIPPSEIAEKVVLTEQTQVAQVDQATKKISLEKINEGKKFAQLSRQIQDLPVWSSNFVLGLTREKEIGFLQLHWPKIPDHVVTEAHNLSYKVEHGWRPPELKGATVESVQAGIIHSPAVSFFMDIYPVIRVIYSPSEGCMGRKPVLYLDRDGESVPEPRQIKLPLEETQQRKSKRK